MNFAKKNRGFILVLVLLFTVALVGAGIGVFKSIQSFRRLNVTDYVGTKLILKSALDYITNGIQKQWCFDDAFVPVTACQANLNGNTIRLSLPEQTLRGRLRTTDPISSITPNPRRAMLTKLLFNKVTNEHPLKFALSQLNERNRDNLALCSVVKRLDKDDQYVKYLPGSGGDVLGFLLIRVSMVDGDVNCTEDLEAHPSMQSILVVYPRELNEFSLIVAGDMDLSKVGSAAQGSGGDFSIPAFADLRSRNVESVQGVKFLSPIYVNHNLVYSNVVADGERSGIPKVDFYAPVSIGDQVRMSDGEKDSKFEPLDARPAKWSEFPYAGLRKGLRVEAQNDLGLDVLSGKIDPTSVGGTVDHSFFQQCLDEAKTSVDRDLTSRSKFLLKQTAAPENFSEGASSITKFQFRMGLSRKDRFVPATGISESVHAESIGCGDKEDFCKELSIDESKISIRRAEGFENESPVVRIGFNTVFQGSSSRVDANLTAAETLTIPFDINRRKEGISSFSSTGPEIQIKTEPYKIAGFRQPDQISISIQFKDSKSFIDQSSFILRPFTLGHDSLTGDWQRSGEEALGGAISFAPDASGVLASAAMGLALDIWKTSSSDGASDIDKTAEITLGLPDDSANRGQVLSKCREENNWAAQEGSFLGQARFSWDFALGSVDRKNTPETRMTFDASTNVGEFQVASIMNKCVVTPQATLVAGFILCDDLTIESRAQPLEFIGTLIVARSSHIHPSAVQAGITFSSIHEPSAAQKLRAAKMLSEAPAMAGIPWWHPRLQIERMAGIQNALPAALRSKAIPFSWTAVDPDCGLLDGLTSTACDKEIKNLVVSEIGSKFDL